MKLKSQSLGGRSRLIKFDDSVDRSGGNYPFATFMPTLPSGVLNKERWVYIAALLTISASSVSDAQIGINFNDINFARCRFVSNSGSPVMPVGLLIPPGSAVQFINSLDPNAANKVTGKQFALQEPVILDTGRRRLAQSGSIAGTATAGSLLITNRFSLQYVSVLFSPTAGASALWTMDLLMPDGTTVNIFTGATMPSNTTPREIPFMVPVPPGAQISNTLSNATLVRAYTQEF